MRNKTVYLSAMAKEMITGGMHTRVSSVTVPVSLAVAVPVAVPFTPRVSLPITVSVVVSVLVLVRVILDFHVNIHDELRRIGEAEVVTKKNHKYKLRSVPKPETVVIMSSSSFLLLFISAGVDVYGYREQEIIMT
jgi:hypothetical protein